MIKCCQTDRLQPKDLSVRRDNAAVTPGPGRLDGEPAADYWKKIGSPFQHVKTWPPTFNLGASARRYCTIHF